MPEAVLTKFKIPKMDCPSEEQLIRLALKKEAGIRSLSFDLPARSLSIVHEGGPSDLLSALRPLNLGASILSSEVASITTETEITAPSDEQEARVLKILLAINFAMFVAEICIGFVADSTGLIADSLDMLADAVVYGISLYAVGRSYSKQASAAKLSGYFQILLALAALTEVGRKLFRGSEPSSNLMMSVALVALIANVTCLFLLARHRNGKIHMKASWIFSTNDVLANLGVILAGFLVASTHSPLPDLIIGTIIALIVLRGAFAILNLSKHA